MLHPYWPYYWLDLPWQALTGRERLHDAKLRETFVACQTGAAYLRQRLAADFCTMSDGVIAQYAQRARRWRELAPFLAAVGRLPRYRLQAPADLWAPGQRLLLTAHFGSFYAACLAFEQAQLPIAWLARPPDTSHATPVPERLYLQFNYWAVSRHLHHGRFIYTEPHHPLPKNVLRVLDNPWHILGALIDLPPHLLPTRRLTVRFLGGQAPLPCALIDKAISRRARIYTAIYRHLEDDRRPWYALNLAVEAVAAQCVTDVLQTYADRLTKAIAQEPWLWMGLPIVQSFHHPPDPP